MAQKGPRDISVIEVATQAFQDQKPGTSGLRKKVEVFKQDNYVENFIQATLEAAGRPKFLVAGGDGRYYSKEVMMKIINVCAANNVERLMLTKDGYLSTPAASSLIRHCQADGGFILTASHNPGGPEGDFGIKYNISNGGPAPESLTDKVYEVSKNLSSYKSLLKKPSVNLSELDELWVGRMKIEVVDPVDQYLDYMRKVFDFDVIKSLFQQTGRQFNIVVDGMHGVMGTYMLKVLVDALGIPRDSMLRVEMLPDFGGGHPDPNLTYAKHLVEKLKTDASIDFGVAFDGDGDRNMILGSGAFFVTPGDSLAVIAAHLKLIPYMQTSGVKGFARSFPTSPAVDRVASKMDLNCYETPTGWKFFGNLMDKELISLCGEESFGTGSDHIREKDGLWACLAWLTILANTKKSVKNLVEDHWKEFGRDYFTRHDFEDCAAPKCKSMMKELEQLISNKYLLGKRLEEEGLKGYDLDDSGDFMYKDPTNDATTCNQGLYVKFTNGARIIWRLSGTGSSGATLRLYINDYSKEKILEENQIYLQPLINVAYKICKLTEFTGRTEPTVIT